jgi:hypothetical protein
MIMFKKKKKEDVEEYETEFDAQYDTGVYNLPQEQLDNMMKALDLSPSDYFDSGIDYKFNEAKLIDEFKEYVDATYGQHYAKDKFQATEFIIDGGHGAGFCIGNVMKYAQRYGKKGSREDARKDLMKVLHYALIGLYVHDTDEQEES